MNSINNVASLILLNGKFHTVDEKNRWQMLSQSKTVNFWLSVPKMK